MSIPLERLQEMLCNPSTREQVLDEIGNWVKDTCLLFGTTPSMAYQIAFIFVEGVAATHEHRAPDFRIVR